MWINKYIGPILSVYYFVSTLPTLCHGEWEANEQQICACLIILTIILCVSDKFFIITLVKWHSAPFLFIRSFILLALYQMLIYIYLYMNSLGADDVRVSFFFYYCKMWKLLFFFAQDKIKHITLYLQRVLIVNFSTFSTSMGWSFAYFFSLLFVFFSAHILYSLFFPFVIATLCFVLLNTDVKRMSDCCVVIHLLSLMPFTLRIIYLFVWKQNSKKLFTIRFVAKGIYVP